MEEVTSNLPYHLWKISHSLYKMNVPLIPLLIQQALRFVFGCLIPYRTQIGYNVHFSHMGMGIVIHPDSIIGNNVRILHQVTIGGRENSGFPVIKDYVEIGAGAKVLGGVTIGNHTKIGANAVVIHDVPDGMVAVGIPARNIAKI